MNKACLGVAALPWFYSLHGFISCQTWGNQRKKTKLLMAFLSSCGMEKGIFHGLHCWVCCVVGRWGILCWWPLKCYLWCWELLGPSLKALRGSFWFQKKTAQCVISMARREQACHFPVSHVSRVPGCLVLCSGLGNDQKSHWQTGRQASKSHVSLVFKVWFSSSVLVWPLWVISGLSRSSQNSHHYSVR